ncbi:MAG: tRNA lysidine(34) synthetase TilS [Oscillospiraceae bacterium]
MEQLLAQVRETAARHGMLAGQRVVAGLSGGADSVCMVLALRELGFAVTALHINHNLRGAESLRDAAFCAALCDKNSIPLVTESVDVRSFCAANGLSLEEGAREVRYRIFEKHSGAGVIATAHTRSDSLETALLNLTRGTGLKGLCGIPPVRKTAAGGRIIRPLIDCTRAQVEAFLSAHGQAFVTDSTNASDTFSRNKLRLHVVPVLAELNPALAETFGRTAQLLAADQDYLDLCAQEALDTAKADGGFSVEKLAGFHEAVRRRALAKLIGAKGLSPSFEMVTRVESLLAGGKTQLSGGLYAVVKNGLLTLEEALVPVPDVAIPLTLNTETDFLGRRFVIKFVNNPDEISNINKTFANHLIDYDKIIRLEDCVVRNRRPGDRIRLAGRSCTSAVKNLLNAKIPPADRGRLLFIADAAGLCYAEGFGCATRCAPDSGTKRVIYAEFIHPQSGCHPPFTQNV